MSFTDEFNKISLLNVVNFSLLFGLLPPLFSQISYNVDNIDSPNMLDKFTRSRFTASLRQVGTKPAVGWIAVTSTGLVNQH